MGTAERSGGKGSTQLADYSPSSGLSRCCSSAAPRAMPTPIPIGIPITESDTEGNADPNSNRDPHTDHAAWLLSSLLVV